MTNLSRQKNPDYNVGNSKMIEMLIPFECQTQAMWILELCHVLCNVLVHKSKQTQGLEKRISSLLIGDAALKGCLLWAITSLHFCNLVGCQSPCLGPCPHCTTENEQIIAGRKT